MTKRFLFKALAIMAVCAGFMTSAYAEEKTVNGRFGWQQDATGTWWKMTGGSGYLSDGWYWIDGNNGGDILMQVILTPGPDAYPGSGPDAGWYIYPDSPVLIG